MHPVDVLRVLHLHLCRHEYCNQPAVRFHWLKKDDQSVRPFATQGCPSDKYKGIDALMKSIQAGYTTTEKKQWTRHSHRYFES